MTSSTPLQRPVNRNARLNAIEQVLTTNVVTSQSQLAQLLTDQGIEVTQATLSRDLDEMNATKTRLPDGTVAYTIDMPATEAAVGLTLERAQAQMAKVLPGLVTSVACAANQIVIHTPSGAAQYVASIIDRHAVDGILGSIAGDDTVLVICTSEQIAIERSSWLLDIASTQ